MARRRSAFVVTEEDDSDQISTVEEDGDPNEAMADQEEEDDEEMAKPVGEVIRVAGTGEDRRKHYRSFEYTNDDVRVYEIGETVLLIPATVEEMPYIATIREISEDTNGRVWVKVQWFYRSEEALKVGGGHWEERYSNELFYSFHYDEVPAESVMHECVIHFVPLHKKIPSRRQHPGFVVQRVYDLLHKRLLNLTDGDLEEDKQREIYMLVEKTRQRLGELPDVVTEHSSPQMSDCLRSNQNLEKKKAHKVPAFDSTTRFEKLAQAYSPGSGPIEVSEYHVILSKFRVLTGDAYRDKWLEKLLCGTQFISSSKVDFKIFWPDEAIPIITELERVTFQAMGVDFQKYNQKMRQLDFNLKNSKRLATRVLKKEIEPVALLAMSPEELKEGLTVDERMTTEPEEAEQIRMTGNPCNICSEKKVGVADIIQGGRDGERYQLLCTQCGNKWYASRDAVIL